MKKIFGLFIALVVAFQATAMEKPHSTQNLVPMGMGVMQIAFSPYDQKERVNRITATIRDLLKYAAPGQKAIINTALVYGMGPGEAEKLVAQALQTFTPAERSKLIVLTWVGLNGIAIEEETADHELVGPQFMYGTRHYEQFINESHANLSVDQFPEVELWVGLHRVNPHEDVYAQIKELKKIKDHPRVANVGLSEVSLKTLRKFDKAIKIGFLETELSISRQFAIRDNILEVCKERNIVFLAYSPLDRGIWTTPYDNINHWLAMGKQHPFLSGLTGWNNEETVRANYFERSKAVAIAQKRGMNISQLALAWIMRKGALPIPDSTSPERSADNFKAIELKNRLTAEDMKVLDSIEFEGKRYQ